jgi:cyclophilin family peptidyl-prolyl cis-trans isomerase
MLKFTSNSLNKKKASAYATTLRAFMDFELIEIPTSQLRSTEILEQQTSAGNPISAPLFRLEFELFGAKAPLCTENFARLCTGDMVGERSEAMDAVHEPSFRDQFLPQLTYKKSCFHRVARDFAVQGGDITETFTDQRDSAVPQDDDDLRLSGSNPNSDNARRPAMQKMFYVRDTGRPRDRAILRETQPTISAFGEEFDAGGELGLVKFDQSGLIGTAVTAPHKNHSQFFILLPEKGAPHLDGTCVCFGRVTKGLADLKKWQKICRIDFEGKPLKRVQVAKCGML